MCYFLKAVSESPASLSTDRRRGGFTLIEVLLVVAVIAILSGVGVAVVNNVAEGSRVTKLESDVAVVNSAVQVFRASGGAIPVSPTPAELLAVLKQAASAATAGKIAGFRGGTIDPRMVVVMQTAAEGSSGKARARWDAGRAQFVITSSGASGVKRFDLDDAAGEAASSTADRAVVNAQATTDPWVWDYADSAATTPSGPSLPDTFLSPGISNPSSPGISVLAPPVFDPPGGTLPIFDFPVSVTVSNPNPPGVSRIRRRPNAAFNGAPIAVAVGDSLSGYFSQSVDPDEWADSADAAATYTAVPFKLVASLSVPAGSMNYADAGGTMYRNGAAISSAMPPKASVEVANLGGIPPAFQEASRFRVVWTTDGSNPLTSGTAVSTGPFTGGAVIDLPMGDWTSTGLQVRAAVKAIDGTYFESSTVMTETIGITKMTLNQPLIDPQSAARSADLPVQLYTFPNRDYPSGTRIYYATNGSDPGVSGSEPTGGTLYAGAFQTGSTDGSGIVRARIYPPTSLAQWFAPSAMAEAVYTNGAGGTGAVVADATINGIYIGSLIITSTKNFNLNSGAAIKAGNLYVRGTPEVNTDNGGVIEGRQFLSDGSEVIPATDTRKVIDLNGDPNPSNYTIRLNSGSKIEGKVYRRVNIFTPPPVAAPPGPDNNRNANINSQPAGPLSASTAANVNLNNGAGEVVLNPGNWGNMNTGSGTSFVIGTVGSTTPTVYNFQSLNLNSGSQLKVVGPVILTIDSGLNLSSSILGNSERPEWLNLRIHAGNFSINSSAAGYADLNAPDSNVNLNGTFTGSVIGKTLSINGNGVAITQAIITQE